MTKYQKRIFKAYHKAYNSWYASGSKKDNNALEKAAVKVLALIKGQQSSP